MGQPGTAGASIRPAHIQTTHGAMRWPFRSTLDMRHEGIRISEYGVGVPARQEVEFADGTRLWLKRVDDAAGVPCLFKRELGAPAAGAVIDLRDLVPDMAHDLPIAATRDVPGIVHYALRHRFASAGELIEHAVQRGSAA